MEVGKQSCWVILLFGLNKYQSLPYGQQIPFGLREDAYLASRSEKHFWLI